MLARAMEPLSSFELPGLSVALDAPADVVDPLETAFTGPTTPPWAPKVGSVVELTFAAAALNASRVLPTVLREGS